MKKVIAATMLFCFITVAKSQVSADSIFEKYNSAITRDEKTGILNTIFGDLAKGTFAERVASVIELEEYFKSKKDKWGTGNLQLAIANGYRLMGLYDSSINYALHALKIFEEV